MNEVELYGNLINGEWIKSESTFDVIDKYTSDTIARVSHAEESLVKKAVSNAHQTFNNNQLTVIERYNILMKAAEIFKIRKEEIAQAMLQESGKTITDSRVEVDRGIATFIAAAEEAKQITGEGLPIETATGNNEKMAFSIRVPVGVVCAITPFNYPFNLTAHKVAPALAAGNTIVLKPAEKTPISAMLMAEILIEAGLPNGFLNVVNGFGHKIGPYLTGNKNIAMFTFTGSPGVGEIIKNSTGIRKVTLELGNNSPNIIHHDVKDLDRAVNLVVTRGYSNSGQACISVQRVYVHQDIYEQVLKKAKEIADSLIVGDPSLNETNIGPMISEEEAKRAESWIEEAVSQGAEIVTGGTRKGPVLNPTILKNTSEEMKVMCEEVFAPVISIVSYSDIDDVFEKVNNSDYGLQVGIFTSDFHLAMRAAKELEFGGVNINDVSTFRADILPYGGIKDSGVGKEGPKSAIKEMTDERIITLHVE